MGMGGQDVDQLSFRLTLEFNHMRRLAKPGVACRLERWGRRHSAAKPLMNM